MGKNTSGQPNDIDCDILVSIGGAIAVREKISGAGMLLSMRHRRALGIGMEEAPGCTRLELRRENQFSPALHCRRYD